MGADISPPGGRLWLEALGAAGEVRRLPGLARRLRKLPVGTGRPVMVIPGYGTNDLATVVLRRALKRLGHDVRGWGLGVNHGSLSRLVPSVEAAVRAIAAEHGPIPLVGWSLGGTVAREVARNDPHIVEQVITLGTPVIGGPRFTAFAASYSGKGLDMDRVEREVAKRANTRPLRVPITSVYTRRDEIVAWRASIDPYEDVEHVEVDSTHVGLVLSADVVHIIATRIGGSYGRVRAERARRLRAPVKQHD